MEIAHQALPMGEASSHFSNYPSGFLSSSSCGPFRAKV